MKLSLLFSMLAATCTVICIPQFSTGQVSNTLLENPIELADSATHQIGLSVYSNTFFKNNEYFDNITTGYTLFGTQLQTAISYQPHPNIRIQAGMYSRKDFGQDGIQKIEPLFSIKLQKNGYSMLMGNLEGNVSHQLIEPIYNFERFILHPLESGLQWKINHKRYWSDTWLNWEVQEYLGSNYQEQLSGGHSSRITLWQNESGSHIVLPLQGLISHKGGQIDIDSTPLRTLVNLVGGIDIQHHNKDKGCLLQAWRWQTHYCLYSELSPTKRMPFEDGAAYYINAQLESRYHILLSAAYWKGKHFLSSRGGELFQSAASIYGKPGYTEANRELLFLRLMYQQKVFDVLNVDVRFEPYYDLRNQFLAYSYAVYLTYKYDFALTKLTKRKNR